MQSKFGPAPKRRSQIVRWLFYITFTSASIAKLKESIIKLFQR